MNYRQRRRAESHRDAMAGEETPPPSVPDHPLIPANEPELLTEQADLDAVIEHVRSAGLFAYDTEFIGELTYHPRICLIQIATVERVVLVDSLAELDLTGLWDAIADPELVTLVHAGQQDLEPVHRHRERPPAAIFDTQIAAGFVGLPYPCSLRRLVESLVGVKLGKAMTFTDWAHRPLSPRHRRYAADDVRYLPALHAALLERLDEHGHRDRAAEECRALLEDPSLYAFDADALTLRLKNTQRMNGRQLAQTRELVVLRDTLAREHDVPPRTLLRDEVLVRIVRDNARTVDKLRAVRGLPRPVVDGESARIIEALERGADAAPPKRPRGGRTEESAEDRVRIDAVIHAASAWCIGRAVDPSLTMSRADVARFWSRWSQDKPLDGRLMEGWRREFIGEPLRGFLDGERGLELSWEDGLRAR